MCSAGLAAAATNMRQFDEAMWKSELGLGPLASVTEDIRVKMEVASKPAEEIEEEGTEGVDLYRGSFSLAYGTFTLFRVTKMHLEHNSFYGLLGPNQCGTTTLMRAISNEQLEGFPKRNELKSVFAEHETEDEEVGVQDDGFPILSVDKQDWRWMIHTCNKIYKLENPVNKKQCKELMKSTGFGYPGGPDHAANLEIPVTSYSGGWQMKVQLCAVQMMNCDMFMLDEPIGHLGVDYVKGLEDRKLKIFKGVNGNTLAVFVEKYPEKKAYFEPSNETMKIAFPEPGPFEGVKTRGKVVLRTMSVDSQTVSQICRVAVIGASQGLGR